MRVGLVQLTVSDDPAANLPETLRLVRAAAAGGAEFVLTPECTNGLSSSHDHQRHVLKPVTRRLPRCGKRRRASGCGC